MTPEELFKQHYGGNVNMFTPVIVEYGWLEEGRLAYELSRDDKSSLWGVVVLEWDGERSQRRTDLRMSASTEQDARAHIQRNSK